jgi:primosomal protein N' (replication factor Y)
VEDEINIFFPEARVKRFDLDTARTRQQYEQIIANFESGAIDILVGTQIISKGMDFGNVNLVGILNADNLLNFPDFRAQERSFQLIAQVSGRAGRREKQGRVIIQSFDPANEIIRHIRNNDFESVYKTLLTERKEFNYPPYYRLIRISFRHRRSGSLIHGSDQVVNQLRKLGGLEVLGPQSPMVGRIKNFLLRDVLLKIPKTTNLSETKNKIKAIVDDALSGRRYPGLQIVIDVDPY